MKLKLAIAAAALSLGAFLPAAHAQTLEVVRVRLPNGQLLSLDNGPSRPWYREQRVAQYHSWYYEPRQRVYVVYNEAPRYNNRWDAHGHPRGHWDNGRHNGHHRG